MISKHRSSQKKSLVSVVATAVVVMILLVSGTASAGASSGPITQVEYNAGSSSNPQILLQQNGISSTNYYAQQTTPGCSVPALSADTIKVFISLAQAALLSGKSATIYYNTCSTLNYIYDIVVAQ